MSFWPKIQPVGMIFVLASEMHLKIGVLSPRQCLSRLQAECPNLFENTDPEAFSWLNELIWREFYRHLIVAYPSLCQHQPFMAWTDKIIWHDNPQADAAPYFRIFNPTLQGKKYDPTGAFVRHWLPELTAVPERYIHTPHEWATKQGQPLDYPLPIVDHGAARIRTLAAFEHAKKMAGNV